jgi:hypothetical protein
LGYSTVEFEKVACSCLGYSTVEFVDSKDERILRNNNINVCYTYCMYAWDLFRAGPSFAVQRLFQIVIDLFYFMDSVTYLLQSSDHKFPLLFDGHRKHDSIFALIHKLCF